MMTSEGECQAGHSRAPGVGGTLHGKYPVRAHLEQLRVVWTRTLGQGRAVA